VDVDRSMFVRTCLPQVCMYSFLRFKVRRKMSRESRNMDWSSGDNYHLCWLPYSPTAPWLHSSVDMSRWRAASKSSASPGSSTSRFASVTTAS
jgi:hypothetical protein